MAAGDDADRASETWHKVLIEGHRPLRVAHVVFRHLPSAPRCKVCHNPFGGVGGKLVALAGFRPSRKNPTLCTRCCDTLPVGGAEVDVGVLFADVRGSTTFGEHQRAESFARVLNRFYAVATQILIAHDAIIDKLIGDEVMALFIPGIAGPSYRAKAVDAGVELVSTVRSDRDLRGLALGAGVHAGAAYVGNVGGEGVVDFTALGDAVNVASRLQHHARANQVVVSAPAFDAVRDRFPAASPRRCEIAGRDEPVDAFVVDCARQPVP
jgi:adenylate cyclase